MRSIAIVERKMPVATFGCPFGCVAGAAEPLLGLVDGTGVTGGKGGSVTSASVRMGFGASAGGKYSDVMSGKRPPG